jgi:intein-encoded DNA endonuclease-like protein
LFNLIKISKNRIEDEKEAIAYLRGYFCGEAYVGKSDREIQIGSNEMEQLIFSKKLLEKIGIKSSISIKTSTSPPRLIITKLSYFIILEKEDIFKFHLEKKENLIRKILNYKSLDRLLRKKLEEKLKKLEQLH